MIRRQGEKMQAAGIGFDGDPPEYREPRDLSGRGKRRLSTVHNVSASRIEWLFAHSMIQEHQLQAARRLKHDSDMGQILGYAALSAVPGTGGTSRLSDAKLDASARVRAVCDALGGASSEGWRVVYFVVVEELRIGEVARRHQCASESVMGALRVALNVAARHYGLL